MLGIKRCIDMLRQVSANGHDFVLGKAPTESYLFQVNKILDGLH
jgi:hypothetical protein